ncbi:MAG: SprT family zinc-dependent metalloprotease [Gracilimonas sp.]|nr:SprT family zinc-dependent metalloprotease [Gracilimonas sp.]
MGKRKVFSQHLLHISGLEVMVLRKNVKNLNLRVYPSKKEVKVSVPKRAPKALVLKFIESKLPWIRKHLNRTPAKKSISKLKYSTGETHFVWGEPYTINVIEKRQAPKVLLNSDKKLILQVRPDSESPKREQILNEWYRNQLKGAIPQLIAKWEPEMGVSVKEFGVKRMKTRWGTCNIRDRRIWLNLELAKKRPELLEYVVVHEMVHLLERLHSKRFYAFMSQYLPDWNSLKDELNGGSSISDC